MGFFKFEEQAKAETTLKGYSIDLLHRKQCAVCPLNRQRDLRHPHMEPTGTKKPVVYMLGEGPGKDEDRRGIQFIGRSGQVLRNRIPDDWLPALRWNNVVRTRPPGNREPTPVEIECCRPSIIADIERTKPVAIFGFGGVPLDWALKEAKITGWAGRHIPVKIGKHLCWYFPMFHPSYIMRTRKFEPRNPKDYGSDLEFAFYIHLRNAFRIVEDLPEPRVVTKEELFDGVQWVTGANGAKDLQRVLDYIDSCFDEEYVGFDYETTGIRPYPKGNKILTVGLAREKDAFAFPLYHREAKWTEDQLDIIQDHLEHFLYESKCKKIAHHLGFELEWTGFFYGREAILEGEWEDTESQAFILDQRQGCLNLDFLFLQYFGMRLKGLSGVNRKKVDAEPLVKVLPYNALDARAHRMLFFAQLRELRAVKMEEVYRQQLRRVITMALTQLKGVPVDQDIVGDFYEDYKADLDEIEADIRRLPIAKQFEREYGEAFVPSNNNHVLDALRNLAGFRKLEKTEEKFLTGIKHPLVPLIIEYRSVAKVLSTYVLPVVGPELAKELGVPASPHIFPDGRMHPVMNTSKVRSNRTSSEDPNVQNWPHHTKTAIVRKQVRPERADERVVCIDYSGMQARNVAMESLDRHLIKVYWERYDIHTDWRERILRVYPQWLSKEDRKDKKKMAHARQEAKNKFVFPTFFNAQPMTLASGLGIPEKFAAMLKDEFFDEFPEVHTWHGEIKRDYFKLGYVDSLSGFRRHAPVEENQIYNSPIQADEAIIVCGAQERLSRTGLEYEQANWMIHDDLSFIWPMRDIDRNVEIAVREMLVHEFEWTKTVPLAVEVKVGKDWHTLEKYGEYESDPKRGGFMEITK